MKNPQMLLRHATRYVPFYQRYEGAEHLNQVPIVTKEVIRTSLAKFISIENTDAKNTCLEYAAEAAVGNQPLPRQKKLNLNIYAESTSGTSGKPFCIFKTIPERVSASMVLWSLRKSFDDKVRYNNFLLFAHLHSQPRQVQFDPEDYNLHNLARLYEQVVTLSPRWIHSRPSVLCRHIEMLPISVPSRPKIAFVESTGEFLTEDQLARIQAYFGCRVLNHYGCTETWTIGYGEGGGPLSIAPNMIVEIVDDADCPIDTIGKSGRILITSLGQRLMPIIRYATGDIGEWVESTRVLGGKDLRVYRYRENNLICVEGTWWDGNVIFAHVIEQIYARTGLACFEYIQVRHLTENQLQLALSNQPGAADFCAAFSALCTAQQRDCDVRLHLLSPEEISAARRKKHCLYLRTFS